MSIRLWLALALLILGLNACGDNGGGSSTPANVSFSAEVQPIFNANCIVCHSAGGMASFMRLTSAESYASLVNQPSQFTTGGTTLVVPLSSAASVLYMRISGTGLSALDDQMPMGASPLSSSEQGLIGTWIDEGALNN